MNNSNERLDDILDYLRIEDNYIKTAKIHRSDVGNYMYEKYRDNITPLEVRRLFYKLISDELIEENNGKLHITDKGFWFSYRANFKALFEEKSRLESQVSEAKANRIATLHLTTVLAICAGIPALYYLYLLYQDLCWCQFLWQYQK